MSTLTIELQSQPEQADFNERRWAQLISDPILAQFEGRIETDRHGQVIMSPPPAPEHGDFQGQITNLLFTLMPPGKVIPECPISTADGVRSADVAYMTIKAWNERGKRSCFPKGPLICVEVMSPDNTERQIREKAALYFDAGSQEVWICDLYGSISFLESAKGEPLLHSNICPLFPTQLHH